jgi:hypothetical protein
LISSEPTIEALTKSLCFGLPSMGLFSDEGGQFLGSSTMSRDNRLKAVTTLSALWDGSPIDRSRSMPGESLRAYDRRLSLHLMLQPCLAGQLLKDPLLNGQGIFARCLIIWPNSLAGQRLYQPVDLSKDPQLQCYRQRISTLLNRPWSVGNDGSLEPKALPLRSLADKPGSTCTTLSKPSSASSVNWPMSGPAPPKPRTTSCASPVYLPCWKTAR